MRSSIDKVVQHQLNKMQHEQSRKSLISSIHELLSKKIKYLVIPLSHEEAVRAAFYQSDDQSPTDETDAIYKDISQTLSFIETVGCIAQLVCQAVEEEIKTQKAPSFYWFMVIQQAT